MMHKKAVIFQDYELADKILKAEKAGKQKKLGRLINNFDNKKWSEISEQIVYTGNFRPVQLNY